MVCAPVRRYNPRAIVSGLSTVQADKPCTALALARYGVSPADWVSADYCKTSKIM